MGSHERAEAALRERILDSVRRHSSRPVFNDGRRVFSFSELGQLIREFSRLLARQSGSLGLMTVPHPVTYALYLAAIVLGRTVVPLSPVWTAEQTRAAIEQTGVDEVVRVRARGMPIWAAGWQIEKTGGIDVLTAPNQTEAPAQPWLYVLHTSGSTGLPKSVPVGAHQLMPFIDYMFPRFDLGVESQMSSTFDLAFDVSVFDLLGAVLSGATLHIPQGVEYARCAHYVRRCSLTHWFSVPSVINSASLLGELAAGAMPTLRFSLFVGEPLTWDQVGRWRTAAPGTVVENVYGPTELALACSSYRVPEDPSSWPRTSNSTVPIGPIFEHLESRIGSSRDSCELLVRGPQRFDGYIRQKDNEGAFEAPADSDPLVERPIPSDYWYRTGDRVDVEFGGLVFHGRVDRQVKIGGYRVELGEIEFAFLRQRGVHHASAVFGPHGDRSSLVLVLSGDVEDRMDVEKAARACLPRYMWPSRVQWVDAMPLTYNGKVDHGAVRGLLRTESAEDPAPAESHPQGSRAGGARGSASSTGPVSR